MKEEELFEMFNRVGLQQRDEAKECALIHVNGILRNYWVDLEVAKEMHPHAEGLAAGNIYIWQEVKQILTDKY